MNKYTHFSLEEREIIGDRLAEHVKPYRIALELWRSPSSVNREIARNSVVFPKAKNGLREKLSEDYRYRPGRAETKYLERKKLPWWRPPLKNNAVKEYVLEKLRSPERWSPDIIAGTLKAEHPNNPNMRISHECIYQFIYSKEGRKLWLSSYLLRSRKKRKKHHANKAKRTLIPNRVDISERSPETEKREEVGHWEGDSVVGVGKGSALHTEVERKTRFFMVKKIPRKGAEETKEAMISLFSPLPNLLRKTSTLDNGCEFTRHTQVASHLQMKIYFAKPYHSWERGSNENANGMIRRYFPKGTDFDTVSDEAIQKVVYMINNRPRKILGYKSSAELFAEYFP